MWLFPADLPFAVSTSQSPSQKSRARYSAELWHGEAGAPAVCARGEKLDGLRERDVAAFDPSSRVHVLGRSETAAAMPRKIAVPTTILSSY